MSANSPTVNDFLRQGPFSRSDRSEHAPPPAVTERISAWSGQETESNAGRVGATSSEDLGAIAKPPFPVTVTQRLIALIRYAKEDGDPLPLPESLEGLSLFLQSREFSARPLLSADDKGYLVAHWQVGQASMLSMKFLDQKKVQFAWTIDVHERRAKREWGESEWKTFVASFPYAELFFGGGS